MSTLRNDRTGYIRVSNNIHSSQINIDVREYVIYDVFGVISLTIKSIYLIRINRTIDVLERCHVPMESTILC